MKQIEHHPKLWNQFYMKVCDGGEQMHLHKDGELFAFCLIWNRPMQARGKKECCYLPIPKIDFKIYASFVVIEVNQTKYIKQSI